MYQLKKTNTNNTKFGSNFFVYISSLKRREGAVLSKDWREMSRVLKELINQCLILYATTSSPAVLVTPSASWLVVRRLSACGASGSPGSLPIGVKFEYFASSGGVVLQWPHNLEDKYAPGYRLFKSAKVNSSLSFRVSTQIICPEPYNVPKIMV